MDMSWLMLLLVVVATYRLTRLVTADRILDGFRAWAERSNSTVGYLVTCDWCLSIWVAPLPTAAVLLWPDNRLVLGVLVGLVASAGTGLLSLVERKVDG
jgi:hypothetical protein